jgi:hypothetical protein
MRRFPPPRTIDEHAESFIVHDANGQALGYFYFEEEFGRRSAHVRFKATAVIGCVSSETARSRMDPKETLQASNYCVARGSPDFAADLNVRMPFGPAMLVTQDHKQTSTS